MDLRKGLLIGVGVTGIAVLAAFAFPTHAASSSETDDFVTRGIYTPAHPTAIDAFQEFLDIHPEHPAQPIAFTHTIHLLSGMQCVTCHVGVDQGPEAQIPNVTVCMTCHMAIDTDNSEIKKIAAYQARGEAIPWVRVYNYSDSAHVMFNHAPHIRAGVDCVQCHGDMTKQTTAERKVNLN